jgi:hypothetical protein
MNIPLFNTARVIHNPKDQSYTVEYKKRFSFTWNADQRYRYYIHQPDYNVTFNQKRALELAKERVDELVSKAIVYENKNVDYY